MSKYQGVYLRDNLADDGTQPSVGPGSVSPDIICYQNQLLLWRDAYDNYGRYLCKEFLHTAKNNIYIRARNLSSEPQSCRVKVFYSSLNILMNPPDWNPVQTSGGAAEVSLAGERDAHLLQPGEMGLVEEAFQLYRVEDENLKYCILAVCSDKNGEFLNIPDRFDDNEAVFDFLHGHAQIALNNIVVKNPFQRTFSQSVVFGNHDSEPRAFTFFITVNYGMENLHGCKLELACTHIRCPFRWEIDLDRAVTHYEVAVSLPGAFLASMDVTLTAPGEDGPGPFCITIENMLALTDQHPIAQKCGVAGNAAGCYALLGAASLCSPGTLETLPTRKTLSERPAFRLSNSLYWKAGAERETRGPHARQ